MIELGALRVRIDYGWITVGLLLLLLTVSQGIITAGIPVFDARLIEDLGITRGALKFRDFVQILSASLTGLLVGYVSARIEPRRIAQFGLVVLAICLFLYSQVGSANQIYALHALLGLCYSTAHVIIVVLIVNQWFQHRKATAIGIALAGTSLGSAVFPQVGVWLMEGHGWRAAMQSLGIFPLLVLPLLLIWLKTGPYAATMQARSSTPGSEAHSAGGKSSRRDLILLALATFALFYASASLVLHSFLNLKDQHFTEQQAATGLSILFITGLFGKMFSGFLAERWGAQTVWLAHQAVLFIGSLCVTMLGANWALVGLVLLGYGWGGSFSLTQVMVANRFSGPALGKLLGWFIVFEGVSSGSGSWLTGVMFDHFGSYQVPFTLCSLLIGVAILATLMLGEQRTAASGQPSRASQQ